MIRCGVLVCSLSTLGFSFSPPVLEPITTTSDSLTLKWAPSTNCPGATPCEIYTNCEVWTADISPPLDCVPAEGGVTEPLDGGSDPNQWQGPQCWTRVVLSEAEKTLSEKIFTGLPGGFGAYYIIRCPIKSGGSPVNGELIKFSAYPVALPTASPTTSSPTATPTADPTSNPTTSNPTTSNPTTAYPTTANPTTANPTILPPTSNPTTASPTGNPTANPTSNPTTANPTTSNPTTPPLTANPTTANPTARPSASPTATPTAAPTEAPTAEPTFAPSAGDDDALGRGTGTGDGSTGLDSTTVSVVILSSLLVCAGGLLCAYCAFAKRQKENTKRADLMMDRSDREMAPVTAGSSAQSMHQMEGGGVEGEGAGPEGVPTKDSSSSSSDEESEAKEGVADS